MAEDATTSTVKDEHDDGNTPDADHEHAIQMILEGRTLFITGGAGVGKSYLIRRIIKAVGFNNVVVGAPTWSSANLIGGMSLHRLFRINPNKLSNFPLGDDGEMDLPYMLDNVREPIFQHEPTLIIIDEISMVSGDMLMWISCSLRKAYKFDKDFGGKQVVLVGDFSQLPPIKPKHYKYAFDSPVWCRTFGSVIAYKNGEVYDEPVVSLPMGNVRLKMHWQPSSETPEQGLIIPLKTSHRQTDIDFAHELEKIRLGANYSFFNRCITESEALREIVHVNPDIIRIAGKHEQCTRINKEKLDKIPGEKAVILALDVDQWGKIQSATEQDSFGMSPALHLKIGAKIILIKSLKPKDMYHNGLAMFVESIVPVYGACLWEFLDKQTQREINALDQDKNKKFIDALKDSSVMGDPGIQQLRGVNLVPVSSRLPQKSKYVGPTIQLQLVNGYVTRARFQLPVVLGYAITIHRSQGMTFDKELYFADTSFDSGMVYVALSRCRRVEDLYISGRLPKYSDIDIRVLRFLAAIYG